MRLPTLSNASHAPSLLDWPYGRSQRPARWRFVGLAARWVLRKPHRSAKSAHPRLHYAHLLVTYLRHGCIAVYHVVARPRGTQRGGFRDGAARSRSQNGAQSIGAIFGTTRRRRAHLRGAMDYLSSVSVWRWVRAGVAAGRKVAGEDLTWATVTFRPRSFIWSFEAYGSYE